MTEDALLTGDSGWVLALTALMIVPILAFASMAVDLGAWYARAAQLQRASDAAALAGAPYMPSAAGTSNAAVASLQKNGICTNAVAPCTVADPDYSVTMGPVTGSVVQFYVEVQDSNVNQFFSKLVRPGGVDIARRGTAERIKPVPLGSPKNYLGTYTLSGLGITSPENYWMSVSGACMRREYGDKIIPYADNNGGGTGGVPGSVNDTPDSSCFPGTEGGPAYVRKNPFYDSNGYIFGIEFQPGVTGTYNVQIYDPGTCQGGVAENTNSPQATTFTLRSNVSNDPLSNPVLVSRTWQKDGIGGGLTCSAANGLSSWYTLHSFNPTAGTYYLQVQSPKVATNVTSHNNNQYAIRVFKNSWQACSADSTEASGGAVYNAQCPKVFATNELPVYVNLNTGTPTFYLASVEAIHAGKIIEVELFDAAEGMSTVELLDPNNNPISFVPEIACQDGTYNSDTGSVCQTGETAPTTNGGLTYGPWTSRTAFDICGTKPLCGRDNTTTADAAAQAWGWQHLIQRTQYSNRTIRLRATLPVNYTTVYGARTWWKIRYTRAAGSSGTATDRTTWTVRIKGDPVRLVPNS